MRLPKIGAPTNGIARKTPRTYSVTTWLCTAEIRRWLPRLPMPHPTWRPLLRRCWIPPYITSAICLRAFGHL